jgi:hypothetical protein
MRALAAESLMLLAAPESSRLRRMQAWLLRSQVPLLRLLLSTGVRVPLYLDLRADLPAPVENLLDGRGAIEQSPRKEEHRKAHWPRIVTPGVLAPLIVARKAEKVGHLLAGVPEAIFQRAQVGGRGWIVVDWH